MCAHHAHTSSIRCLQCMRTHTSYNRKLFLDLSMHASSCLRVLHHMHPCRRCTVLFCYPILHKFTMAAHCRTPACPITGLLRDGYTPPDLPPFGSALAVPSVSFLFSVCIGTCLDRHMPFDLIGHMPSKAHAVLFLISGTCLGWHMPYDRVV